MRTLLELRGTSCIPMEEEREIKDQLIYSRSFSQPVTDQDGMEQVLSIYAQMASTRLHRHDREAKVLTAWAMTSYFNDDQSHQPAATVALPGYSADPVVLTKAAKQLLPKIRHPLRASWHCGHRPAPGRSATHVRGIRDPARSQTD